MSSDRNRAVRELRTRRLPEHVYVVIREDAPPAVYASFTTAVISAVGVEGGKLWTLEVIGGDAP